MYDEEVLVSMRIKKEYYEGNSGHYIKYGKRGAMEIATLGCAVTVKLSEDKKHIADLRLAYGVAAPTPIRCTEAETLAHGEVLTDALLDEIARTAAAHASPRSSWRASREFRLQLITELARRAIRSAWARAGGVF